MVAPATAVFPLCSIGDLAASTEVVIGHSFTARPIHSSPYEIKLALPLFQDRRKNAAKTKGPFKFDGVERAGKLGGHLQ